MRPLKNPCEVTVIGGGLAGLSAARHAARLGRLVTLFEGGGLFGGLVATVGEVTGLPVPGLYSGQDLAIHLLDDARKVGVRIIETAITEVDVGEQLQITDSDEKSYRPDALIVATGATLRKLGVPGEEEFFGRGVSRCATCDGGFFRGGDVVVVGGGDAAVHEALVLAKTSRKVTMVCRSPLRAKASYVDKLAARENVAFVWDSEVAEVIGDSGVTGVRVRNVRDGSFSDLACAGVFPFIGVAASTDFLPKALLTATAHVKTDHDFASNDPRIFAVGAVRAGYRGNLVEAMAEGYGAAEAIESRLRQDLGGS